MSRTVVIVTEKASVAKAVANALIPKRKYARNAYVGDYMGNNLVVTRSDGHMFGLYEPHDFNPAWKKWSLQTIPEIISAYELSYQGKHPHVQNIYKPDPLPQKKELIEDVTYWCGRADMVIGAQDPDYQGDLISHLVKVNVGYDGDFRREPISALDAPHLLKQFSDFDALRDEKPFLNNIASERVRSKLDAFLGFVLSRTLHLKAQEKYNNIDGLLAGGRIQFPILGLLGRREREIANFVPTNYYNLFVNAYNQNGDKFRFEVDIDRIKDQAKAEQAINDINQGNISISTVDTKKTVTAPPPPYKLDTLTTELGQVFNYSPKEVLSAAEALYLKELITYPRTDTAKITYAEWENAKNVLPQFLDLVGMGSSALDFSRRSEAVLDKNASLAGYSHFGFTPTGQPWKDDFKIGSAEWHVFEHIVKRYAMMFLPDRIQEHTSVKGKVGSYYLKTHGTVEVQSGWYQYARQQEEKAPLAPITKDDSFKHTAEKKGQSTKAPARYTKATINDELANIAKHLSPSHQHLKAAFEKAENPGLGSAATRSDVIEAVFNHGLATEITTGSRKVATLTRLGIAFHDALPEVFTLPDLFAEWENDFRDIIKGSKSEPNVLDFRIKYIKNYVLNVLSGQQVFDIRIRQNMTGFDCPKCGADISRQSREFNGVKRYSWLCIHCSTRRPDFRKAPLEIHELEGSRCLEANCPGHYQAKVALKKNTTRQFFTLACDTCKKFRPGSFEWEYEIQLEFRGTKNFLPAYEGASCDKKDSGCDGVYKTVVREQKDTKRRFLVTSCTKCRDRKQFLFEKPDLEKRPDFGGNTLEPMDGEGSYCSCSIGVMIPRVRKDRATNRSMALLQCDNCDRIEMDSVKYDKELTRPGFRGRALPKLAHEGLGCSKSTECEGTYTATTKTTNAEKLVFAASVCSMCGDMKDFLYENPRDKRARHNGEELKHIPNEFTECASDGCYGLMVPRVKKRRKDDKPYAVLQCDVCRTLDKNSFTDL